MNATCKRRFRVGRNCKQKEATGCQQSWRKHWTFCAVVGWGLVLKSELLWMDRPGRARGELRLGWRRAAVAIGIRGWGGVGRHAVRMARRVPGDSPVDGAPLGGGGIGSSRIGGVVLGLGLAGRLFAGPLGLVGPASLVRPRPLALRNFLRGDGGRRGGRRGGNRGRRRWLRRSSLHAHDRSLCVSLSGGGCSVP